MFDKMLWCFVCLVCMVQCWPAASDQGFVPSHFQGKEDQMAVESSTASSASLSAAEIANLATKSSRLGFTTYTGDVQNYPGNNVVPGLYGPIKLDIGGLVLGTIVGLGAFFLLPKLLHVVTGPYGPGYKRSEEEIEKHGSWTEISRKLNDSMEKFNLDSSACMQRALCSTIQYSENRLAEKSDNSIVTVDSVVDGISKNALLRSLLTGSDWKRALEVGRSGESCGTAFPKCPFTVDSVVNALVKYFSI